MREPHTCVATVVGTNDSTGAGIFEFDARVLILRGEKLNVWVGEDHFVTDTEGDIQRGQFLLVKRPESGAIARIVEPNADDAPEGGNHVKLELEIQWDTTNVDTEPVVEYWSRDELEAKLTGRDDTPPGRELGEAFVWYVRPTNR
ncbi:hypothetical protein [Haloferax sp. YSMS24]|uniref:hypothetical protein n=1 Tax=Haloferax sp. YSMS24 TaxID=3388425 RepID=UPI00398D1B1C